MRILVVADTEEKAIYDFFDKERIGQIDLLISCGDLSSGYLDFLQTMTNSTLLYVRGNHDEAYDRKPPPGGICIDDKIYDFCGLRIMGLGGSMRYKPGPCMFTEREMQKRGMKLKSRAELMNGFDILVTHAPAKGFGDMEDMPHQGFEAFNELLNKYHPRYMLHGHVHKQYGHFQRSRVHPSGTVIINACGYYILEVGEDEYPKRGKTGSFLYDLVTSMQDRRGK